MNFSPLPVVILMAGIILIYAAMKDVNPKVVIQNALKGKPTVGTPATGYVPPPSGFGPGAGAGKGGGGGGEAASNGIRAGCC
jgi:hypothetical protein